MSDTFKETLKNDSRDKKFDCLRNAERIMATIKGKTIISYSDTNSCTVIGNRVIGKNDERNIENVNKVPEKDSNDNAQPIVGQAYFVCRTDTKEGGYPYHAAAVLYRTKEYTITLETSGGTTDWFFGKYATVRNNGIKTFHDDYVDTEKEPGRVFKTVAIKLKDFI